VSGAAENPLLLLSVPNPRSRTYTSVRINQSYSSVSFSVATPVASAFSSEMASYELGQQFLSWKTTAGLRCVSSTVMMTSRRKGAPAAFATSPAHIDRGAAYEFVLNHVLDVDSPTGMFRLEMGPSHGF